jgi:NAD+ synthase
MITLTLSDEALSKKIDHIIQFIREQASDAQLVIGLSGGIDSDTTARLCFRAVGKNKLKFLTVLQGEFDPAHLENSRRLAQDLGIQLIEIPLAPYPKELLSVIAQSDPGAVFDPTGTSLDVQHSKIALRTFVFSTYVVRGYLVVGTSNLTEFELGFFHPFGDHISHFCPLLHMYKTQVRQLARALGTSPKVLAQAPAAGVRTGDDDMVVLSYWLYNEGPIEYDLALDMQARETVFRIYSELSYERIDLVLSSIAMGLPSLDIARISGLSADTVYRLQKVIEKSRTKKRRAIGASLLQYQ